MIEKKCRICKAEKLLSEFATQKGGKGGVRGTCKECRKEYNKVYYRNNSVKIKKQSIDYRKEHPEETKLMLAKNYEANKEERKANQREWYKNNKDKVREYNKKDHVKEQARKRVNNWIKNNPHKYKAQKKMASAVRNGTLDKPTTCSVCGDSSRRIEGHHWSYDEENWLNVVWCCKQCHSNIHHGVNQ